MTQTTMVRRTRDSKKAAGVAVIAMKLAKDSEDIQQKKKCFEYSVHKIEGSIEEESKNITNLNTYGFSFSAIYKPEKRKIKKYIHAIRFNYTQLESSKSADNFITLYSLEYLKYNVNIFMENPIFRNVSMGWDFSIQKRNGDYLNYSAGKLLPFKTVYLLNLKDNYKYKKIKI